MSAMADLDIVLTRHKLSDAQKNAVVELLGGGFTSAKPNTIKSLEKKGLVINKGDFYLFEQSFKAELKAAREAEKDNFTEVLGWSPDDREPSFHEQLMADVAELEEELNTNMWDAPVISEEEIVDFKAMAEKLSGVEDDAFSEDPNPWTLGPETFDKDWALWERQVCGFEATIGWKNTDVWDGLTAQEIREDMDTAIPIGRKARRERARLARKILAAV